jgi:hypothetical protein
VSGGTDNHLVLVNLKNKVLLILSLIAQTLWYLDGNVCFKCTSLHMKGLNLIGIRES